MSLGQKKPRNEFQDEMYSQLTLEQMLNKKTNNSQQNTTNNNVNNNNSDLIETCFKTHSISKTLCNICNHDISLQIKIICSECNSISKPFIYCLNCLLELKHPNHDYHIIDKMNFPLFTTSWPMTDELRLISSIEKYGLDNWGDISDNMLNRGKVECESHYYTFYYKDKEHKYPSNDDVILTGETDTNGKFIINPSIQNKNEQIELNEKNQRMLNQGTVPELTQLSDRSVKNNGRSVIRGNRNRNESNIIQSASEILGYWPKREEFDIEFLNDAELEIAELEFLDEDNEHDKKLKMDVLKVYNSQLDERKLRKDFIINKKLLDLKRQNNFESKLSKEDREIFNFLKPFARFYDYSDFFDLYEGLVLEKNLKQKLYQLKTYMKQNIKTVDELQKYLEVDLNQNNILSKNKKNLDYSYITSSNTLTNQINNNNSNNHNTLENFKMNLLGERVSRFLKYNSNNLNGMELSNKDKEFVKELPLPKSTFYDIREKVDECKKNAKNINDNKEKDVYGEICNLLSQYDIESNTLNEIKKYFEDEINLETMINNNNNE